LTFVSSHPYSKIHLTSKMTYVQFVNRLHLLSFFHGFYSLTSLILNTHPCPIGTCPFSCLSSIHLFSNFSVLKPLMHLICTSLIHALPTTKPHFCEPLFSICPASTYSTVFSPWGLFLYSNLTWIFQTVWLRISSAYNFRRSLLDLRYTQIHTVKIYVDC
jgi:hypothetical protein